MEASQASTGVHTILTVSQDSPVSNPDWPDNHALWLECAADTIKRLRNHPCIALWCGGNEQVGLCPAFCARASSPSLQTGSRSILILVHLLSLSRHHQPSTAFATSNRWTVQEAACQLHVAPSSHQPASFPSCPGTPSSSGPEQRAF